MRRLLALGKFRRLGLAAALLTCLVVTAALLVRPSTPPPVLALHEPFSKPLPLRDRLAGWIPGASTSAWGWRLGNALFGQRKSVNIYGEVVALSARSAEDLLSSLALGKPVFAEPDGLQVWFLRGGDIQAVRQRLKQTPGIDSLGHPRMMTADGVEVSLEVGTSVVLKGATNDVGLKMVCFPRVHSHSTDLFTVLVLSEAVTNQTAPTPMTLPDSVDSIRTNLDIEARLQIPKGSGALLVKAPPDDARHRTFALIIDPP
jgi:hypothetical protein